MKLCLMCRSIGQSAFFYSGLRSFAMYEPYARFSDIDGTALDMTRIFYDYELVICRCTFPDELFIMTVGRNMERKPIRFPEGSLVMLGKNSAAKNWCLLDLSACRIVDVSRKPFSEDVHFYYNSVIVDFPKGNMPPTLPARVGSSFFDVKGYHTDANCGIDEVVTRENVQLVRHCIDSVGMNSITFRSVRTCETEPVEVISPNCYDIHEFTWEENGQTYHKFNTPFEILHDKDSVYHLQLKAFVIRKDKQTGQSIFYDRSLFLGKCTEPKTVLPNRHDKVLIAVDVLRSTPKPEEESTEMYRRFLLKNHHHAVKAAEALPEQWHEYRDFLALFYELNSL